MSTDCLNNWQTYCFKQGIFLSLDGSPKSRWSQYHKATDDASRSAVLNLMIKKYSLYILYNLQTIQVHETSRMQGGINFQTILSSYCNHQVKLLTHLNSPVCSCWTMIIFCLHDLRLLPRCKIFDLLGFVKHRLVISYWCFGMTLTDRIDRLSWKVRN